LLTPYEQHRSLSVRVEKLPQGACLSRGRNNGDHTWSLKLDDLDGLLYLPPDGMDEPHTLAIRVIGLDDDNSATLALLDLPVRPGAAEPEATPCTAAPPPAAALEEAGAEHANEIARLTERHTDDLRQREAAFETRLAQELEALSNKVKSVSKKEFDERLAVAVREAVEKSETEAGARLEQARRELQADHAKKLAVVTTRSEKAEAYLKAMRGQTVDEHVSEGDLRELRGELKAAQARLAVRESELADTRTKAEARLEEHRAAWQAEQEECLARLEKDAQSRIESALQDGRQEAETARLQAEETWKAEEAARLAAAEAQWRDQSAQALAEAAERFQQAEAALQEARSQAETTHNADAQAELDALQSELAETRAALAERDAEVAQVRAEATAQTQAETANDADAQAELGALHGELAETRAVLAERDVEVARARAEIEELRARAEIEIAPPVEAGHVAPNHEMDERLAEAAAEAEQRLEQARQGWRAQTEATLVKAWAIWKSQEAGRLDAARTEWQEHARFVKTSTAVSKVAKGQRKAHAARRFMRAGVAAACLVAAIMVYPRVEPLLVDQLWPKIVELKDDLNPLLSGGGSKNSSSPATTPTPVPTPTPAPVARTVIGVSFANVRAGPSTATATIMRLRRGQAVIPLERRGNWVRIRVAGGGGKQGWAHRSLLKTAGRR